MAFANVIQWGIGQAALALFLLYLSAPICRANEVADITIAGILFPAKVAEFERNDVINNESDHPGLGWTIYYNMPGIKASIYIYDLEDQVPDGINDTTINAFAQASTGIRMAYREVRDVTEPMGIRLGGLPVIHQAFEYVDRNSDELVVSHLTLTGIEGNFLKVRATSSASEFEQTWPHIRAFLNAVYEQKSN